MDVNKITLVVGFDQREEAMADRGCRLLATMCLPMPALF